MQLYMNICCPLDDNYDNLVDNVYRLWIWLSLVDPLGQLSMEGGKRKGQKEILSVVRLNCHLHLLTLPSAGLDYEQKRSCPCIVIINN